MRNLGLIISFWLSAISIPTSSVALGLGGIEVNSFLNQPLQAEIEVISARPGEIDDLLVTLASRDAFTRAGLSRPQSLSDIRFTVQKSEEGDSAVILVTTKSAIKEPFLNFLVEADWSKGRLLREFTILLDPPFFAESAAQTTTQTVEPESVQTAESSTPQPEPDVSPPIVESDVSGTASAEEQQTITEPIALSEEDQVEDNRVGQALTSGVVARDDVVVKKGDTLWSIASALQDGTHSMSQIMLAIQRANPQAFGDNNINNLKVGSVLRMPEPSDMDAVDQQQAYAQVLEQNGLWEDYVARVTGQAAVSTVGQAVSTGAQSDSTAAGESSEGTGELSLVTPGDGSSDAAGLQSEGDDANELRLQLTLAEEELDASRVQNRELESRIAELEAQLSKFEELQKMIEIEDDSLAQLQENQAQQQEAANEAMTEAISQAQQSAEEEALLEELLTEETAQAGETLQPEAADSGMTEDGMTADGAMQQAGDSDAVTETVDSTAAAEEQTEQLPAPPAPVIVTEAVQDEPSFLDSLLPSGVLDMLPDLSGVVPSADSLALDPVMLGAFGGVLVLITGLLLYRRKKSNEDTVVNDPIFAVDGDEEDEELTPIHLAEGVFEGLDEDESELSITEDAVRTAAMDLDDGGDEFARTAVISSEDMPAPEEPAPAHVEEQDDILNEADVYLAYNLYDNAEELLTSSLEANPERADYRAKLLDTYFATKNANAFVSEAETLKSMGRPADRYWDRVMVMGYELAPDNELFAAAKDSGISAADLEFSKPAEADFDLGAEEDDTNFSTTDFDLGEENTGNLDATDFSSGDLGAELEAPQFEELPDQAGDEIEIDEDSLELPDLGEADENTAELDGLDFSLDGDEDNTDFETEDNTDIRENLDDLEFGLPEDMDLGGEDLDLGTESTAVLEAGTAVVDVDNLFDTPDDDDSGKLEPTAVIGTDDLVSDDDIDFGMEQTAIVDSLDVSSEDDMALDLGDMDDADDALSMDVDMSIDESRTDTFAPGDFEDPEEIEALETDISSAGLDDIEDLMLPDDVDEVSTKLDLARAFIDMGDAEGARSSLEEVLQEGNDEQKAEAKTLMDQL